MIFTNGPTDISYMSGAIMLAGGTLSWTWRKIYSNPRPSANTLWNLSSNEWRRRTIASMSGPFIRTQTDRVIGTSNFWTPESLVHFMTEYDIMVQDSPGDGKPGCAKQWRSQKQLANWAIRRTRWWIKRPKNEMTNAVLHNYLQDSSTSPVQIQITKAHHKFLYDD